MPLTYSVGCWTTHELSRKRRPDNREAPSARADMPFPIRFLALRTRLQRNDRQTAPTARDRPLRPATVPLGKMNAPRIPRPFGSDTLPNEDFDALVEQLAVPHRARAAHWSLVRAGAAAADAVERGLRHADAAVRRGCCDVLD